MATTQKKPNGAIIYRGPSQLNGSPIVVIVTGLASKTANTKTGDMLQTWILREDVAPNEAIKTGQDAAICGDCPHRGVWSATEGKWTQKRTCYVKVFQAPLSVWKAYKRGNYRDLTGMHDAATETAMLGSDRVVRLGSYGDPMAVPLHVWESLTSRASAWTGYTHQWRTLADAIDPEPEYWEEARSPTLTAWQRLVMASADTESDAVDAAWNGWRYFRVMPKGDEPLFFAEVRCPASREAGAKTQCASCKLCMGTTSKARKSIAINIH